MSVISGTQHFIIPKKIVWTTLLVGVGAFIGMYIGEHIRAQNTEHFLKAKNEGVKMSNDKLKQEKTEYQVIFGELTDHLDEWKKGRDLSLEQQAQHVSSFQEQAQLLMEGLSDMQTLLEEKEFQLWEKEGLLEYQEERLMNSEDLELEMANYINDLATTLLAKNGTLPSGLVDKPYYGSQLANVDDDPANGEYMQRQRRQLRAPEAKPATTWPQVEAPGAKGGGSLREHFLELKNEGKF